MSLADLRSMIELLEKKLETAEDDAKTKLQASHDSCLEAIRRLTDKLGTNNDAVPSSISSRSQKIKMIENALSDVSIFTGAASNEAETFCGRLSQIHELLITQGDQDLEEQFVKFSMLRVSEPVFQHLMESKVDTSTFELFKKAIKETFGPKLNAVQLVNKLYDIDYDDKMKFSLFAQKIHECIRVGFAALNSQWKKAKNTSDDISSEQTALFFGMAFMTQHIKNSNFRLFRDLVRELDEIFDPNQLASRAEYFQDRIGGSYASSHVLFNNRNNSRGRRSSNTNGGKEAKTGTKPDSDDKTKGNLKSENPENIQRRRHPFRRNKKTNERNSPEETIFENATDNKSSYHTEHKNTSVFSSASFQ